MKYANIKRNDVANGPGIRVSLFASGCQHACPGCFNAEAWDFNFGQEFTQETIDSIIASLQREEVTGLTLLGGEPLAPANQEQIRNLIRQVRIAAPDKTIRCYSGFVYEFISKYMEPRLPYTTKIMENIDVLVDGRFEEKLLSLMLRFRGSSNQRVIDIPTTRARGEITWAFDEKEMMKYTDMPLLTPEDVAAVQKHSEHIVNLYLKQNS
ncbi:MAG: anaerobic ribonucleoside-triphosphate reductase activating protein [Candidatus Absconditabacteria bacterium]|nr:anaerobic ribonucleoside-triphosphate reductase activating protein [Candidatus Absconditabacteria bacterium]MDD4714184.1 anaerobic ribonucleoside-triphosphate reductase activating protein [Candidatus Absconditabacteria bacterium]